MRLIFLFSCETNSESNLWKKIGCCLIENNMGRAVCGAGVVCFFADCLVFCGVFVCFSLFLLVLFLCCLFVLCLLFLDVFFEVIIVGIRVCLLLFVFEFSAHVRMYLMQYNSNAKASFSCIRIIGVCVNCAGLCDEMYLYTNRFMCGLICILSSCLFLMWARMLL